MNDISTYSVFPDNSEQNGAEGFQWLWDSDESDTRKKKGGKKKKKYKKKLKKMKKSEKALKRLLAEKYKKKKTKQKSKKQLQREFTYRLLAKSADTTLCMVSDITRMYAQSKLFPSGNSK